MFEADGPQGLEALTRIEGSGSDGWAPESVDLRGGDLRGADLRTRALVSVIRRLASPAVDQLAFLERLDVGVDELALQFTELTTSMPWGLSEACGRDLTSLDRLLAEITSPGNSHLLGFDALESSPEWARVRKLADNFLADLALASASDRS